MMKLLFAPRALHSLFIIIMACSFSVSCTSVDFVKTGSEHPPLPPDSEVQMLLTVDKEQFDEIGIADISGVSLPVRIEKAKQLARSKGGDVIVPVTMLTEKDQKRIRSGYIIQSFYILKTRNAVEAKKPETDLAATARPPDEELIPEKQSATFDQLLREFMVLQGQQFANTAAPLRFYKIPPSLAVYGLHDYKLCLMQFEEVHSVLVFIPKNKIQTIKTAIEEKKSIGIDYTPLGVYKEKYPVLKMAE